MQLIRAPHITQDQKREIARLWNNEYPAKLQFQTPAELDTYLAALKNQSHFFALNEQNHITGWAFTFERDNAVWFAVIMESSFQKKGTGTLLLEALKKDHTELNGWVIDKDNELKANGEPYLSPLPFYLKHTFTLCNAIRLETEKLSAVKIQWLKKL